MISLPVLPKVPLPITAFIDMGKNMRSAYLYQAVMWNANKALWQGRLHVSYAKLTNATDGQTDGDGGTDGCMDRWIEGPVGG